MSSINFNQSPVPPNYPGNAYTIGANSRTFSYGSQQCPWSILYNNNLNTYTIVPINPNLNVSIPQSVTIGNNLAVGNDLVVSNDILANHNLLVNNNLYVTNDAIISNDLYVSGTIYNPSDIKLKTNIEDLPEEASNKLLELRPKEFIFKNQLTQKKHIGLIAQEVEHIFPELVIADSNNVKNVSYIELIPLMIQKIQDLQRQINELSNK